MATIIAHIERDIRYQDSLIVQQRAFEEALEAKRAGRRPQQFLFFNEHRPVITLGTHAKSGNILVPTELIKQAGIELFRTNRGGDVTYHGPGQWTVYPVFDLEQMGIGVRRYVELLEEVSLEVLRSYRLSGTRISGASGVWMHAESEHPLKVCAVGIHCSRFVTMHGIAFNVNTSADAYRWINPCGFADKGVTSLREELGADQDMGEVARRLLDAFARVFGCEMQLEED